jgi:hypothetical protein
MTEAGGEFASLLSVATGHLQPDLDRLIQPFMILTKSLNSNKARERHGFHENLCDSIFGRDYVFQPPRARRQREADVGQFSRRSRTHIMALGRV